jgi:hypothetical protein
MKQSEALDMITKIQLAHQAMESACKRIDELKEENKNFKEALAKQEQGEPVARCQVLPLRGDDWVALIFFYCKNGPVAGDLYTTPQQRTWVGLDPEEIRKTNHHMVDGAYHYSFKQGAEWAEAKLKAKNFA